MSSFTSVQDDTTPSRTKAFSFYKIHAHITARAII